MHKFRISSDAAFTQLRGRTGSTSTYAKKVISAGRSFVLYKSGYGVWASQDIWEIADVWDTSAPFFRKDGIRHEQERKDVEELIEETWQAIGAIGAIRQEEHTIYMYFKWHLKEHLKERWGGEVCLMSISGPIHEYVPAASLNIPIYTLGSVAHFVKMEVNEDMSARDTIQYYRVMRALTL